MFKSYHEEDRQQNSLCVTLGLVTVGQNGKYLGTWEEFILTLTPYERSKILCSYLLCLFASHVVRNNFPQVDLLSSTC